ncbi:winged helix-turn-helix transcriptional regulator [Streptomyces sp. NPDC059649]|uniref:winged helix-turn-helix transcriptional regulator n=1 Tax=Streptomyces sp. NPDC059649 TaxID=3346895 RepID=UPI00369AD38D
MPQTSKAELYAAIRRDHRGGMSMRELERKHGVTWWRVRKALGSAWPEPRLCAAIVDRLTFNGTLIGKEVLPVLRDRAPYGGAPPRVLYALTPSGQALRPTFGALVRWSGHYLRG